MQNQKISERFQMELNALIQNITFRNRPIYYISNLFTCMNGDESYMQTMILTQDPPHFPAQEDEDAYYELESKLNHAIRDTFEYLFKMDFDCDWKIDEPRGMMIRCMNNEGDWMHLQFADETLFFIQFNSGQY